MAAASPKPTVLVTGAGGKTGKLIAQKVKSSESHSLRALFRTDQSKQKTQKELGLDDQECAVADVTSAQLSNVMSGCESMVVATSATPKINYWSLPGFLFQRYVLQQKVMPSFTFPQVPEKVDWQGQKAQFDAAKSTGIKHVVLVSSMGGTKPDSTLNKIGDGNILVWKRKAEKYLIDSGLTYTIFHPGGLSDSEGGQAPIKLDVDDKLMESKSRRIPRADVAELCVQALSASAAKNRSVDCANDAEAAEGAKAPSSAQDFAALFEGMTQNCDYTIFPPE